MGLWRQCLGDRDTSSCQTVLSPETVTWLEHIGPGGLHAVAAGHGPLPPRGQQVNQPVTGLPPAPHLADGSHAAAGGYVRRAPPVGVIQLCHQPPLVGALRHGLDVGV